MYLLSTDTFFDSCVCKLNENLCCAQTSLMNCSRERIAFFTSGPWGNDGWISVSSMWCLNAAPSRYMNVIPGKTLTCVQALRCCSLLWQHVYPVCMFRLWSGFMIPGSFICPHTPPPARVSITHRNCWRSTRTSTSQPRLVPNTQACRFMYVCAHVTLSLFSKPRSVWSCWSSWPMVSVRKATVTLPRSKNGWQLLTNATETFLCAWTSTAAAWRKPWASPQTVTRQYVVMCLMHIHFRGLSISYTLFPSATE